jgi:hypothetical protein
MEKLSKLVEIFEEVAVVASLEYAEPQHQLLPLHYSTSATNRQKTA